MKDFYKGRLVELTPMDIEKDLEVWKNWNRNSHYQRLLDDLPANQYSTSMIKDWFEKEDTENSLFMIRTLEDRKTIGFVELVGYDWIAHSAWVGIGIGDSDYWGKGYGTDAMNIALKFAFLEQNLHRVNLGVFRYNERAVRSYEKSGFKYEGAERDAVYREDQYHDCLLMGVLQSEWRALQEV